MKTRWIPAVALACLLFAPFAARAVTDTWDGGGVNDLVTLNENWVDNTAPVSDIANTDLIFAGMTRLTPALVAPFSVRSITFNNTAGAFVTDGQPFLVGTGGIVNNDAQTMTLGNTFVRFSSVADATINAAVGGLTFPNTVTLPTNTLTVTGPASTSFGNISGSSALAKTGAGTMTWAPNLAVNLDLSIDGGTLTMAPDGTIDFFNRSSTIAVNGTSTFIINESLTLDGAQLTRSTEGAVNLAAGKTLTVQGGGDVAITGTYANTTASTITVTGAGSTLSTTSSLVLNGGSTLTVTADGDVTSGSTIQIGTTGNATAVMVDGAGSTFAGATLVLGANTNTGSLTFANNSAGTFTSIGLVPSPLGGATGMLSIESGADVTSNSLTIAMVSAANTGTVTVTGLGSTLSLATGSTIGAATGSSGTLNVNSGGVFNGGTGFTTVNPTGTINLDGGTLNLGGQLILNGTLAINGTGTIQGSGSLIKNGASTLALPNGNSYGGGTTLRGGTIIAGGISGALGSGDVTVESGAVKLTIRTGVLSAIDDTATLTLAGGGVPNVADNGFAELANGVNEILAGLILGGEIQRPGTYGSLLSPATFQSNEFFSGAGILTVIPEPGTASTLLGGFSGLVGLLRFRRRN